MAHSPEKILSLLPLLNDQIAAEHETETPKVPIIERVHKILANPDSSAVPQLEAEIDRLIYELYGLTEEEFAYNLTTFPLVADPVKIAAQNAYRDVERGLIK